MIRQLVDSDRTASRPLFDPFLMKNNADERALTTALAAAET